jgi:hypothetical protein
LYLCFEVEDAGMVRNWKVEERGRDIYKGNKDRKTVVIQEKERRDSLYIKLINPN